MTKNGLPKFAWLPPDRTRRSDNAANGANAKAYRESKRVELTELAAVLKSPHGTPMTKQSLRHYEAGRGCWDQEFYASYKQAVDKIAATFAA